MRGHNQGSIGKPRKDGRIPIRVTMPDGRRRQAYVPAIPPGLSKRDHERATKEQQHAAERKLVELLATRDARGDMSPVTSLGAYLRRWLDEIEPTVRVATFRHYEMIVTTHLVPALGKVKLASLSAATVQQYLRDASAHVSSRTGRPLSAQTVRHHRAVLRRALSMALRWGLVTRNVATLVDPPRVPRVEPAVLTAEQVATLLHSTAGDRLHALWRLAVSTGLRQAEVLGLTWKDIDLDGATLTVVRTLTIRAGKAVFIEPKTARSRRTVPLPAQTVAALKAHQARQGRERLASGNGGAYDGLVFTTGGPGARRVGKALHASEVLRSFRRALAAADLPTEPNFHSLRHSTASILVASGVHPRVVMELLGHSTIGQTMDRYSHVVSALSREAVDKLSEAIG